MSAGCGLLWREMHREDCQPYWNLCRCGYIAKARSGRKSEAKFDKHLLEAARPALTTGPHSE